MVEVKSVNCTYTKRHTLVQVGLLLLIVGEELPVYHGQDDIGGQEEEKLAVDELVERAFPLEKKSCEAARGGTGDITLVRNGHCASEDRGSRPLFALEANLETLNARIYVGRSPQLRWGVPAPGPVGAGFTRPRMQNSHR